MCNKIISMVRHSYWSVTRYLTKKRFQSVRHFKFHHKRSKLVSIKSTNHSDPWHWF